MSKQPTEPARAEERCLRCNSVEWYDPQSGACVACGMPPAAPPAGRTATFVNGGKALPPSYNLDDEEAAAPQADAPTSGAAKSEFWLIHYDDADVRDEIFAGPQAEEAARARYAQALMSWTCHLYRSVSIYRPASDRPAEPTDAPTAGRAGEGLSDYVRGMARGRSEEDANLFADIASDIEDLEQEIARLRERIAELEGR